MAKVCDMDCFNCKFDDCIKDDVYYDSSSYKNRSESAKKHAREHQAMLRKEAREKGLCIVCRKEPAAFGHVVCKHCALKKSIWQKMKYEKSEEKKNILMNADFAVGRKCLEKKYVNYITKFTVKLQEKQGKAKGSKNIWKK